MVKHMPSLSVHVEQIDRPLSSICPTVNHAPKASMYTNTSILVHLPEAVQ